MATGFETMASRGASPGQVRRRYYVEDAADEDDAYGWILLNTPSTVAGVSRSGISVEEDEEQLNAYNCEVTYGANEQQTPEVDQVDYRFNFQAQGAHVYQSLSTISSTQAGGGTAPDFDGAINVVSDSGSLRCEGLQLPVPPETFTLAYYPENATITTAYQLQVEALVGLVNSVAFKGRPAGSLMLVRAQGGARNNAGWSLELGFGFIANRTNVPVGSITVPSKDGLDLLWAFYEDESDSTANSLIKKPRAAYVERVFYRDDFNVLGI